ncbi:MAG TPA: carotenoid biosynthesis protein [Verrucomicrobiae bacterium]
MYLSDKLPRSLITLSGLSLLGLLVWELTQPLAPAWCDGGMIVLATLASLTGIYAQLPLQNVLWTTLLTALVGSLIHGLSLKTGIPLGPVTFTAENQPRPGGVLWFMPWLWICLLFTARGVARLILRPWRQNRAYGFRLIGLTALLAALLDLGLEPYAWHVKHWWIWQPTRLPVTWQGVPVVNFLGWLLGSLLILILITPGLIRKQPGQSSRPDWLPAWVWLGLWGLFAGSCARAGLWPCVVLDTFLALIPAVLAFWGGRW